MGGAIEGGRVLTDRPSLDRSRLYFTVRRDKQKPLQCIQHD